MPKKLNKKQLDAAVDNAVLGVIDTCAADMDAAIKGGVQAEYDLGVSIIEQAEGIWLKDGEKLTGDSADKAVRADIGKSRNAIVAGLIETGRFDFWGTKFMDACRIAAKFSDAEEFENLSTEFNRTALVELSSVQDDKLKDAMESVRSAQEAAAEKDETPPNVRELVKKFKPTARKSGSVPFPVKLAEKLAVGFPVEILAKFDSKAGLDKAESNLIVAWMMDTLAENGVDIRIAAERARKEAKK